MTPGATTVRSRVATQLAAVDRQLADGQEAAALDSLEQALVAAGPELLRQPFLAHGSIVRPLLSQRIELGTADPSFAVDLLWRLSDATSSAPAAAALLVPLTERELNMLRYLATTLSTREIADKLYVSVNTVKTHQRAIHQKLGARDRRTAVAHARELGLL